MFSRGRQKHTGQGAPDKGGLSRPKRTKDFLGDISVERKAMSRKRSISPSGSSKSRKSSEAVVEKNDEQQFQPAADDDDISDSSRSSSSDVEDPDEQGYGSAGSKPRSSEFDDQGSMKSADTFGSGDRKQFHQFQQAPARPSFLSPEVFHFGREGGSESHAAREGRVSALHDSRSRQGARAKQSSVVKKISSVGVAPVAQSSPNPMPPPPVSAASRSPCAASSPSHEPIQHHQEQLCKTGY